MKSQSIVGSGNKRQLFDFYSTPPLAVDCLIDSVSINGNVWECACGNGIMSDALVNLGFNVFSSDIRETGYGVGGVNFLSCDKAVDNIITNPPFALAEKFVLHGLKVARKKIAFLLKLSFLEGNRRYNNLFSKTPLSTIVVFSKRLTLCKDGVVTKSGMMAFAWFVWEKGYKNQPVIKWCNYSPLNIVENSNITQQIKFAI